MEVFYILGGILVAVVCVLGWLFYSLKKASVGQAEKKVETVVHLNELRPFVPEVVTHEAESVLPVLPGDKEAANLQEEVLQAREKIGVLTTDFNEVIGKIKKENEDLRADIERLHQGNAYLNNEELAHLKAECFAFKMQMDTGNREIARLEAENFQLKLGEDVRAQYQARIDALSSQVKELERDNERLRVPKSVLPEKVSGGPFSPTEAAEALREDLEALRLDMARKEARIEEMEEAARGDQEKIAVLSYELTKSRAHAVGVERICDNARRQFEGIAREAHDTEHDNVLLKRQSDTLEQSLIDFKQLNSELLKREKLTQFELEHNRTQLKDLEHIYQVFRSRLQSAGVSEGVSAESTQSGALPTKS